jgi:hypothetical protein
MDVDEGTVRDVFLNELAYWDGDAGAGDEAVAQGARDAIIRLGIDLELWKYGSTPASLLKGRKPT